MNSRTLVNKVIDLIRYCLELFLAGLEDHRSDDPEPLNERLNKFIAIAVVSGKIISTSDYHSSQRVRIDEMLPVRCLRCTTEVLSTSLGYYRLREASL